MSIGNIKLDILLSKIINKPSDKFYIAKLIKEQYPKLSEAEAQEISSLIIGANNNIAQINASLVATTPPSFSIKAKSTKNSVESMIKDAQKSILITGYYLSDYFDGLIDIIIKKSKEGIFVKFFVNNISGQKNLDKLFRYKGHFLKIYNYPKQLDSMSSLHAKVISVDQKYTLITSANLSYHGQEGNIELGLLVESKDIAMQLNDIFTNLIFSKFFVEL